MKRNRNAAVPGHLAKGDGGKGRSRGMATQGGTRLISRSGKIGEERMQADRSRTVRENRSDVVLEPYGCKGPGKVSQGSRGGKPIRH